MLMRGDKSKETHNVIKQVFESSASPSFAPLLFPLSPTFHLHMWHLRVQMLDFACFVGVCGCRPLVHVLVFCPQLRQCRERQRTPAPRTTTQHADSSICTRGCHTHPSKHFTSQSPVCSAVTIVGLRVSAPCCSVACRTGRVRTMSMQHDRQPRCGMGLTSVPHSRPFTLRLPDTPLQHAALTRVQTRPRPLLLLG